MKERFKRPQQSIITGIIKLLVLFAIITIISVVAASLNYAFFLTYAEYIAFVIFAIICFIFLSRLLTEYSYTVNEGRFMIEKYIFRRPKLLLNIKLSDISYIGRYLPRNFTGRKLNATYRKSGVVFIVYGVSSDKRCAVISPSKKMLDYITAGREELNDK